jgi:septal ring factor EnvC (AmiA/AmiB activator)
LAKRSRVSRWVTAERRRKADRRDTLEDLALQREGLSQIDEMLRRHDDMLATTFRRIADMQAEIDVLKTQAPRRRAGKKR